jgi:hypothetical protein
MLQAVLAILANGATARATMAWLSADMTPRQIQLRPTGGIGVSRADRGTRAALLREELAILANVAIARATMAWLSADITPRQIQLRPTGGIGVLRADRGTRAALLQEVLATLANVAIARTTMARQSTGGTPR